jgi:hypothetical protein
MVSELYTLCGKHFVQEFWRHFLVTAAFLARLGVSLQWTEEIAMASFRLKGYVWLAREQDDWLVTDCSTPLNKHLGFLCKLLKRHSSAHVGVHSCGCYNIDNILL